MGNIVGIDLGTTYSALAKYDDTGRPEIIDNKEGKNVTPSVVEFTSESSYIVGDEAKNQIGTMDENIAHEVKRVMGSSDVEYSFFGKTHTPTSISALILKKLKEDFERSIGKIDSAVVTVPANFSNDAREATQAAADLAGLKVDYIINEPTAAALAFAFQSGKDLSGTFVIYDFGGGTFDCTVAKISGQDIEIVTSEGVSKLGGKDFDNEITKMVSAKYKAQTGKDLDPQDFTSTSAEDLKKRLSSRDQATARILGEVITITREEFDASITNLVTQAELAVESALANAEIKPSAITEVILVGGSTRVPAIAKSIKKIFGKEPELFGNPDESVALGAAIYAAHKSDPMHLNQLQKLAISKLSFVEAAPAYFGTIVLNSEGESINATIIPKDHKIPCTVSDTFYTVVDDQCVVNCTVTQSAIKETDPEFVNVIFKGELEMDGEGRPAGQELIFTYSYTEDGKMRAMFTDKGTGSSMDIDLSPKSESGKSNNSDFDIDELIED